MNKVRASRRRLVGAATALAAVALAVAVWLWLAGREEPIAPAVLAAQRQLDRGDRWAAAAEAEIALDTVRADLATESAPDGLDARVDRIGERLEGAFAGADEPDLPAWSDLDAALDRLEEQVRTDDPAAAETAAEVTDILARYGP